jgi:ribosomal protein S18 acetylase RimI-like enzyme
MNNKELSIRRASLSDAGLIAELGRRTFAASFATNNSETDMGQYLATNFSTDRIQEQLSDPRSTFLLAYKGENIAGYVMIHTGETPEAVSGPKPTELVRIYVETGFIGQGYGSALMSACLVEANRGGYETIWLGVWERNQRAIRFYEKWGFDKVGTKEFMLGRDLQTDFILVRPVEMEVGTRDSRVQRDEW